MRVTIKTSNAQSIMGNLIDLLEKEIKEYTENRVRGGSERIANLTAAINSIADATRAP